MCKVRCCEFSQAKSSCIMNPNWSSCTYGLFGGAQEIADKHTHIHKGLLVLLLKTTQKRGLKAVCTAPKFLGQHTGSVQCHVNSVPTGMNGETPTVSVKNHHPKKYFEISPLSGTELLTPRPRKEPVSNKGSTAL